MVENSGLTDFSGLLVGMIYKWVRKGQCSFTCLTCQGLKLFTVFFILLTILYCSESINIYGFFNYCRDRCLAWKTIFLPEQRIPGQKGVLQNSSYS